MGAGGVVPAGLALLVAGGKLGKKLGGAGVELFGAAEIGAEENIGDDFDDPAGLFRKENVLELSPVVVAAAFGSLATKGELAALGLNGDLAGCETA